ncbi:UbiD family decarboxylase [Methanosphaera sp. Vir-13MRS]|uniref:UbiD family decarboxylase n=1 Tax=Candidatus Methanosphaera massiliense TaxID=3017187 RepID=UPI0023808E2C|nr:UbiD family decarboxylase [Candidatus Methanosphaera massiliense]MDE4077876.1 UbiD family decarboxylase [Candidatus Methanosphaera massiliense]
MDEIKEDVIEITDEVSTDYEITSILKKHPTDTLIFTNVKDSDMNIISGICNTREKIANSINTTVDKITENIIRATNNPTPIYDIKDIEEVYANNEDADLSKIPILKHYPKDKGKYITAGVVIAKDPDNGQVNASIHRMLVNGKDELGIRIVPRQLYTYYKRAEELNKPLKIAIAIGLNPSTLLASTTSIPINENELEVANTFKDGKLTLVKCETVDIEAPECEILLEGKILPNERKTEGPFVDLTDTYDKIRDEPVIKLTRMHYKDNPYYHAILPAGNEHKLLQGLPQEPRIFNSVKNTLPTVQNVILTEGGCCWLHAVVSIKKQTEGDAKNVLMAALSAHPSLKHCVIVDEDINIFDPVDVEYAIATRVKGDDDIIIIPKARGSSLDPVAQIDGTTTKIGVDATKSFHNLEDYERVSKTLED